MVQDAFALWLMNEHDLDEPPEVTGILVLGLFPNPEEGMSSFPIFRSFTKGLTPWQMLGMMKWIELTLEADGL